MDDLVINFTPTGMVPTREMTPHVPLSVEEIVAEVLACARYGVSIVHLHARDEQGEPTYRKDVYGRLIRGIRRGRPDLILCVSTSGRRHNTFECRSEVLDLEGEEKPDMASLTLGSLNFPRSPSVNSMEMIVALAQRMQDRGIKPELEVFDLGMVNVARYLERKGLLRPPRYFNILLGNLHGAQGSLAAVSLLLHELPAESVWALAGVGDCQGTVTSLSVVIGGHVRVGLEDNIYYDAARSRLATNAMLLQRVGQVAAATGAALARPGEVRKMLGLPAAGGGAQPAGAASGGGAEAAAS